MPLGKLIVLEGPDGCGKRTQSNLLFNRLRDEGKNPFLIDFPNYEADSSILVRNYLNHQYDGCEEGIDNLQYVKIISTFYSVDRASSFLTKRYLIIGEDKRKSLFDLYREGAIIICDRYTTSNQLHQSAWLEDPQVTLHTYLNWIANFEYTHLGLPTPDAVFFLDVEPEISLDNIRKRYEGTDKENDKHESLNHLNKVSELKDEIITTCGWTKLKCSENGILLPQEEIAEKIYNQVLEYL